MKVTQTCLFILAICYGVCAGWEQMHRPILRVSDWWNPFSWFEDAVDEIAEKLDQVVQGAGEVFTRVVNDAFRNNINPLVDKIQTFIDYDIDQINKDVQQTIDHAENATKNIISFAEQQAEKFLNVSIQAMEKAVQDAVQQLSTLADTINQDLDKLLDKLAAILSQLESDFRCDETNLALELYKELNEWFPDPLEYCRRCLEYYFEPLSDMEMGQLYNLRKCRLLHGLSLNSSIWDICQSYIDTQRLALQMLCVYRGSEPAREIYGKEFFQFGAACSIWLHINDTMILQKHLTETKAFINTTACFNHK